MKFFILIFSLLLSTSVFAQKVPSWYPKWGVEHANGQVREITKKTLQLTDKGFLLRDNVRVSTLTKRFGSLADIQVGDYVVVKTFKKNKKLYVDHIYFEADKKGFKTP